MHLHNTTYIDHGPVPADLFSRLQAVVAGLTAADWEANKYRQNKHGVHKDTQAYIFRFIDDDGKKMIFDPIAESPEMAGAAEVRDAVVFAGECLGNSDLRLVRALFARLPAKKQIKAHVDIAKIYDRARRLHIPIFTSDKCTFIVGGGPVPMPAGRLVEINNRVMHGVVNGGDEDRVHLIFDVEGE